MLCSLRIKNLALMETATLEFGEGFAAVTGETGAGKSVLLGALGMLAGNRTAKTVIRKDAETCEVEGVFQFADAAAVDAALETLDLPACEEGRLVLRRSLSRNKPPRVHINGVAATLAQMEALGQAWVDFHGPGEPQKLFHERRQLEILDLFAGGEQQARLVRYGNLYREWLAILREIKTIHTTEKMSEDEIAFTRSQLDRLNSIDLTDEGIAALERDFKRASSSHELGELHARMDAALGGDDGLAEKIPAALRLAREISALDPDTACLENRLHSLAVELTDIQTDYARLAETAVADPAVLDELTTRMNIWLEVRRKHGPSVATVRIRRDALAARLALQSDIAGALEKAAAAAAEKEAALRLLADELREVRAAAAGALAAAAAKMLDRLGFKKAALRIRVADTGKLGEAGDSTCEFLFQPNVGQNLLPLSKIASSGETARVMLALKTVLAEVDNTPVLVFDEVDANVGGEIGSCVGRELASLAGRHQVFCVTHLPQVAAHARQHFVVEKTQTDSATSIAIRALHDSPHEREEELARMLGDRHSTSALSHARELLAG
ncbi:MAG: AAA family ATPase [Puniceicoccales bacterium]|jgi:DNA repair protein RecN (Recombination protein N)|nr:AAA family ATPase [Puniceicoccales bacterium]